MILVNTKPRRRGHLGQYDARRRYLTGLGDGTATFNINQDSFVLPNGQAYQFGPGTPLAVKLTYPDILMWAQKTNQLTGAAPMQVMPLLPAVAQMPGYNTFPSTMGPPNFSPSASSSFLPTNGVTSWFSSTTVGIPNMVLVAGAAVVVMMMMKRGR